MTKETKIEYIQEDAEGEGKKIEKLRKILKRCKKERQEYLEGWQRARADHQNYIKQKDEEVREFRMVDDKSRVLDFWSYCLFINKICDLAFV